MHRPQESAGDLFDLRHYLKWVNNCNESDPLLSDTQLGASLEGIQLARVPAHRLARLSQALNAEVLLPTKSGLPRDFRGLSELMGFSSVELEARFKRSHNPAKSLIEAFIERQHFECRQQANNSNQKLVTLNDLLKFLETLQRFDIIDDFLPDLIELVEEQRRIGQTMAKPIENLAPIQIGGQLQYDAFVCYAPEDEEHARELIDLLEQHNKRIFTMNNLLPGQLESDAIMQVISAQCRKVLILLTPNFVRSRECEFQSKFATEIDIKSGCSAKIIPIKFELVEDFLLPPFIRVLSKIDFTSSRLETRRWQLKRLLDSFDVAPASNQSDDASGLRQAANRQQRTAGRDEQLDSRQFGPPSALPIVDLAYSQSSDSAMNLSTRLSFLLTTDNDNQSGSRSPRISPSPLPSPFPSGSYLTPHTSADSEAPNSMNQLEPWYKKFWDRSFKRSVKLNKSPCSGSISPSTSSRVQLVPHESGGEKLSD